MRAVSVWLFILKPNETQNHLSSSHFREVASKATSLSETGKSLTVANHQRSYGEN